MRSLCFSDRSYIIVKDIIAVTRIDFKSTIIFILSLINIIKFDYIEGIYYES